MGQISALFVQKVVDVATADDPVGAGRRRELYQSVGIGVDAKIDPKQMVADTDYYALCERVVASDPDASSVSVRVGSSMRADDYGAFGLAWKSAVDLRGSYARAERYGRVLTSVSSYEVIEDKGRHFMTLQRDGVRQGGLCVSNEQTLVAVAQISREVCSKPFAPTSVHFKHDAMGDTAPLERFFGCQVHFQSDRDALEVPDDLLRSANLLGDASISAFIDSHLERELAELPDVDALDRRVRVQVSQALSEGVPSVSDVAVRLGLSARTLQRRLSEQGHAFQDLVDETRRELAERLLRRTDYALAEIAFLTGFSEQSTFTRAFKRWRGETPASFRRTFKAA